MPIYEPMVIKARGGALPQYTRDSQNYVPGTGVSARVDSSAAHISAAGNDAEARALAGLGRSLRGAAEVGIRAYDEYSRSKAIQALTEYRREMNTALWGENGILTQQGEAAFNVDQQRAERARKARDRALKDAGERTKYYFGLQADEYDADTSLKAQRYAQDQRTKWELRTSEAAAQERAEFAMDHYGNENDFTKGTGEALFHVERGLKLQGYSGEALQRGIKEASSRIFRGSIERALANGDIQGAQRLLGRGGAKREDGTALHMTLGDVSWAEGALAAARDAQRDKAVAENNRRARELLKGRDEALAKARLSGDVSDLERLASDLTALGRTREAADVRRELERCAGTREIRAFAADRPLPEAADRLRQMQAERDAAQSAGDEARADSLTAQIEALHEVCRSRVRSLREDPADAAEKDRHFQLPENATPEDRIAARLDWQRKNGVSGAALRPLTVKEVDSLAAEFARAAAPATFLHRLKTSFGAQGEAVLKQLAASGKFPGTMNLIADMDEYSGALLAQAVKPGFAAQAEERAGMTEPDKKAMQNAVSRDLAGIAGTFLAAGDGESVKIIGQAAYALALQYRLQGMSLDEAAGRAVSEVFTSRYHVVGSFRVPKRCDASAVALGVQVATRELAASGDVAQETLFPEAGSLAPAEASQQVRNALERRGLWVTNGDESGLLLVVDGRFVRTKDGKPVAFSFAELERRGEAEARHAAPVGEADPEGAIRLSQGGF